MKILVKKRKEVSLLPEWFDGPFPLLEGTFPYKEVHNDKEGDHMYSFKHGKHHVDVQIEKTPDAFHDIAFSVNQKINKSEIDPKDGKAIAHKIHHVVKNHIQKYGKSGDVYAASAFDNSLSLQKRKHAAYGSFFRSLSRSGLGKHKPGENFHFFTLKEEAPTNSVAAGGISSLTDGSVVPPKARNKWKDNNAKGQGIMRLAIQQLPVQEGTFAGMKTFKVPSHMVEHARYQKRKHAHWTKYLNDDPVGRAIREFANRNPDAPVILECERTGYMVFARYGKHPFHK